MNQSDAPAIIDEPCTSQLALRCVRIFPGVNSRAELVTLAPGLRFAPLGSGITILIQTRFLVRYICKFINKLLEGLF